MKQHSYTFLFSSSTDPQEVVEVARSPIYGHLKAGTDKADVVIECDDCSTRIVFGLNGCAASFMTKSRYAREMVEILEDVSRGRLLYSTELTSGKPISSKELPVEFPENDERQGFKKNLKRRAKKLTGLELAPAVIDLLLKVFDLCEKNPRATADMFEPDELITLVELEELELVKIKPWSSIELSEHVTGADGATGR